MKDGHRSGYWETEKGKSSAYFLKRRKNNRNATANRFVKKNSIKQRPSSYDRIADGPFK